MPTPEDLLDTLLDLIVPGARLAAVREPLDAAALAGSVADAARDPAAWVTRAAAARDPRFARLRALAWDAYLATDAGLAAFGAPRHAKRRR